MIRRFFIAGLFFLLVACAGTQAKTDNVIHSRADQAVLSIYLGTAGFSDRQVSVRLEEVAVNVDNVWIALDIAPVDISLAELKKQRLLLGAAVAPLGEHRELRLSFSSVPVDVGGEEDGKQQFYLKLPEPLTLNAGDSKCLFVDWQLANAEPGSPKVLSKFSVWGQRQVLGGELLYVACTNINTIYVVRIDTNEVVSAFGVAGPLADIQLDNGQRRLYILSRGRRSIYVYDCLNERLIDQIPLTASVDPQHMVLSRDSGYAYVSDPAAGAVFKVDLDAGNVLLQGRIGHRPEHLLEIADHSSLAVSSPASNQVYLLDTQSLQVKRVLPVGLAPAGLMFFDDSLYVAETGSQSVAVFDLQSGKQLAKISVGIKPDTLLSVDSRTAYVSNSGEATLTALSAGQNIAFRRVGPIADPHGMVYSTRKRMLYVESRKENRVAVVDVGSERVLASVAIGSAPSSLAILE